MRRWFIIAALFCIPGFAATGDDIKSGEAASVSGITITGLTGIVQANGASASTAITDSSTVGQVLRVTGASTYAFGALDLADTDAVTGLLPDGNVAASIARDTETAAAGAISGSLSAGFTIDDGEVLAADLETDLRDLYISFTLETPATADSGKFQAMVPDACTLQEVECNVDAATSATINLFERARATPETGTTGMLTANLVCDTNGANTTSFADSALAKDVPLALGVTAVSGTPGYVRVHVRCRR